MKSNQCVKLFRSSPKENLDSQINEYLHSNPDLKIIKITFASDFKLCSSEALVLFERVGSDQETKSAALLINEVKEQLFESVVAYLERPENWIKLKDCYLINDRSDDLRKLLTEALRNS